jgi:muramidase (phage lysozyme)
MSNRYSLGKFLTHATILLWLMFVLNGLRGQSPSFQAKEFNGGDAPLVMQGGDPYIRALMRTISMSESNYPNPYALVHGGEYVKDFAEHPDHCTAITVGPNTGRCSTAAGRYQFLTTTWVEKSRTYHPFPGRFVVWERYSFEPKYQDAVMYAWLTDPEAWDVDLRSTLRQGNIDGVLSQLSGTWTSLGYGLETNSMSAKLPELYQKFLQEELTAAAGQPANMTQTQQPSDRTL